MSHPCRESKCSYEVLDMAWNPRVNSLTGSNSKFPFICSMSGWKIRVKPTSRAVTDTGSNTYVQNHVLKTHSVSKHNHQMDFGALWMPKIVSPRAYRNSVLWSVCSGWCCCAASPRLRQSDICQPQNKGQKVIVTGRMQDLHSLPLHYP